MNCPNCTYCQAKKTPVALIGYTRNSKKAKVVPHCDTSCDIVLSDGLLIEFDDLCFTLIPACQSSVHFFDSSLGPGVQYLDGSVFRY